jgi:hypothetical protein
VTSNATGGIVILRYQVAVVSFAARWGNVDELCQPQEELLSIS